MNRKIRILLGGYVNNINAQDLNCRALAMFLDKDRFDVSAFLVPQQFRDFEIGDEMAGVNFIQLNRPAKILWYWIYLKGIVNCDIAYLPKGQKRHWCKFLCKLLGKKSFTTVEGVMDKETLAGAVAKYGSEKCVRDVYNDCDRVYSITRFMSARNSESLGIRSDGILYLGVDTELFKVEDKPRKNECEPLDIIFIGTDVKRKRLNEFLDLAKLFPNDIFHVVGGYGNDDIFKLLGYEPLANVEIHGRLTHQELVSLLRNMDVHMFPSRSEGFPKVTLETAAAGVPSIVYSDYGASEWISSGENGYVVDRFEEMVEILKALKSNPEKLPSLSENAVKMAAKFAWKSVIKSWESTIEEIYESK